MRDRSSARYWHPGQRTLSHLFCDAYDSGDNRLADALLECLDYFEGSCAPQWALSWPALNDPSFKGFDDDSWKKRIMIDTTGGDVA